MWYEVLQSDLIPINYIKQGERISIVQKNKIEDPEIYIHYYEASLSTQCNFDLISVKPR